MDKILARFGVTAIWVWPIRVQGSAVGLLYHQDSNPCFVHEQCLLSGRSWAYWWSCWSSNPVSILTAGSQRRSTTVLWVRPHPLKLPIVLVLTPPELWWPLAFHRLLLLGLLLSLFFISLTLGSHSKKFSLLHLPSLRNWKGFFPPLNSWCSSSLPKPKSPDLPCANKRRERLFGWIQKWPWTFAQHSDDRFSPSPPHPNTHASCWIRKYFIAFFPFHFLNHPSSWTLHTYPFPITSLLEN